jgi:pyruvate/2-oxoglutarate dehydrogenase complex dihydrolipoamide acyltransferase (E2) component
MTMEFLLPGLSETSATGTVLKWVVKPGTKVDKGQAIIQVESDKAIFELASPCAGRVLSAEVQEGEAVEVGRILAVIAPPGEVDGAPVAAPMVLPTTAPPQAATLGKQGRPSRLASPARRHGRDRCGHAGDAAPGAAHGD